jgi:hypothetical protein
MVSFPFCLAVEVAAMDVDCLVLHADGDCARKRLDRGFT